jgi:hypothetical protein
MTVDPLHGESFRTTFRVDRRSGPAQHFVLPVRVQRGRPVRVSRKISRQPALASSLLNRSWWI